MKKQCSFQQVAVPSIAAASQTTILITGKSLGYAERLKAIDIDEALGSLPDDHKYCAELAIRTLKNAIIEYRLKR